MKVKLSPDWSEVRVKVYRDDKWITLLGKDQPSYSGDPFARILRPDFILRVQETFHASPDNAFQVLEQAQTFQRSNPSIPWRDRLVKIIFEPGEYRNLPSLPGNMQWWVGSTGNAEDVVFVDDEASSGTWHFYGDNTWVESLTVKTEKGEGQAMPPKYPIHITNTGTFTAINVHLHSGTNVGEGGPTVLGADGGGEGVITLYSCKFSASLPDGSPTMTGFNMHGPDEPNGRLMAIINSTGPEGMSIGYKTMGSSPSKLYVQGGNISLGLMEEGANATGYSEGWPVPVSGLTTHWLNLLGIKIRDDSSDSI